MTDDQLFDIAVKAWESQTSHEWYTDALEAVISAVRAALAAQPPPAPVGGLRSPQKQEASEQFVTQQPDGSVRLDAYAGKTREELKARCRKLSMALMNWQFTAVTAAIAGDNKLENIPEPHFSKLRKFIDAYSDDEMPPAAPVETDIMGRSVMQRFLAAAGWDAGGLRHKQLEDALDGAHLQIVPKGHPRLSAGSREDALEAQGIIEQLEKQLAFERKKSEPNFLHAGSPLWRISMLCEQQELYTKDELVGLIQKVVQDDFCSRAQRIANDMG